ncbi:permease [Sedimentitalea sp. CY04]|uniref:Permease n=1 Tax=Parasedimentitalea denitrificans TaxID=2211118 RepID=A0ABX0WAE3_9RHOB|nr:permease [Sedimentitalea sp. CY04]NIZ62636.1 permease [Sedimentitalea sp. CY04]
MSDITTPRERAITSYLPDMPLVIWMVLLAIGMGFYSGMSAPEVIRVFNTGFGSALGEFALILLPSFALAAALSRQSSTPAKGLAAAMSPIAGAGMICPDTAYAALSPIAGRQKLDVAFGSYAGFKLLFPAGPLIVATGLSVTDPMLPVYGLVLLVPVWLAGSLWARSINAVPAMSAENISAPVNLQSFRPLTPFAVLALLLLTGAAIDLTNTPVLDFLTLPKGALLVAATLAMFDCPSAHRRTCLESAVRRTGSLLLVIGAATAFGAILIQVISVSALFPSGTGLMGVLSLFALSTLFKLAQGSSMATFAAVAPVAAPLVTSSNISNVAAVFAICLGSFIAILPNDSFYWLVRRDALSEADSDGRAIWVLTGGAIAQALTGLILIGTATVAGLI